MVSGSVINPSLASSTKKTYDLNAPKMPFDIPLLIVFNTSNNALARCPHCRKISAVGPDFARGRGVLFLILGVIFILVGIGVTAGTFAYARKQGGIYVVYVGAFVLGLFFLARSIHYRFMRISTIEGPM